MGHQKRAVFITQLAVEAHRSGTIGIDMSASATQAAINPWARILDALEKKINRHSFDTWLKPTRYSHTDEKILFISVPSAEFGQMGDKYADVIL